MVERPTLEAIGRDSWGNGCAIGGPSVCAWVGSGFLRTFIRQRHRQSLGEVPPGLPQSGVIPDVAPSLVQQRTMSRIESTPMTSDSS